MRMLGEVLNNLKINKKYNIAFSTVTHKEIQSFKKEFKNNDDIFDLISSFLSNVKDVKAILFLREEKFGEIKGSLRTNDPKINIVDLAKYLNGGGHPKAAGFDTPGHIEKTKNGWRVI